MTRVQSNPGSRLDLALVHYPVQNRKGELIGSAVTNLDIHDIARIGRTYGINRFYLVTPYAEQHELVAELLEHWLKGRGGELNPHRKEALELVRLVPDLAALQEEVGSHRGASPLTLATSARVQPETMDYHEARRRLERGDPILILLGTASGLAPEALSDVDAFLPPISGGSDYNHLPVRAAAAIILDRLLAP